MRYEAVFCDPQEFTYRDSGIETMATPANLGMDEPGMVWRSSGLDNPYFVMELSGKPFDTLALVGSNLRASDTIRIRMGATQAEVGGEAATYDETIEAWSGITPLERSITTQLLTSSVIHPFLRMDFTATGHPEGHVEMSRLVVGQRVVNAGVDIGDEETFVDGSAVEEGLGFTTIDPYGMRNGRKISISGVRTPDLYENWQPFLSSVGRSRGWLFLPTTNPQYLQRQIRFVRNTSDPKMVNLSWDQHRIELTTLSVG